MVRLVVVLVLSGCTIGVPLTVAAVEGTHNHFVDHAADKWSYTVPLLVGAGVGVVLDYLLFKELQAEWSKPMT